MRYIRLILFIGILCFIVGCSGGSGVMNVENIPATNSPTIKLSQVYLGDTFFGEVVSGTITEFQTVKFDYSSGNDRNPFGGGGSKVHIQCSWSISSNARILFSGNYDSKEQDIDHIVGKDYRYMAVSFIKNDGKNIDFNTTTDFALP